MSEITKKPFYITFGSSEHFPYQNGYIIVIATSEKEACEKFREKYPDKTPGIYNFSFIYGKEAWNGISSSYGYPEEILGISPKAIEYINAFCQEKFESDADFSDPEAVGVFYTTVDYESETHMDLEIELQNNINLVDMSVERYLENTLFEKKIFNSEEDFLWELKNLNKSDLVYVTAGQFVKYYRIKAMKYLEETKAIQSEGVTLGNGILTVSYNLDKMIEDALVIEGYEPTEYTKKEVLDCLCDNPFNMNEKEFLKNMLRGRLVNEIKESIAYLEKPSVQNKKGKE